MNLIYILERPGDLMKKVERDKKHLYRAICSQEQERISDSIFNFVVTAYHIKDWLKKEPSVGAAQINVEDYVNQNLVLCVCGDLCNSSKHRHLDNEQRSSAENIGDSPLTVDMTTITVDSSIPINCFTVKIKLKGGAVIEILKFADDVIEAWTRFFQEHGIAL